jgi:hypothetical protein
MQTKMKKAAEAAFFMSNDADLYPKSLEMRVGERATATTPHLQG